jgi:head-tail adaptor
MSYQFTAADLVSMRAAQDGHMLDTCDIQAISTTTDSFGQVVESWPSDASDIACGLDMRPGAERHGADKTVVEYDATVRLPIGTTVDLRSRIRVTKRFNESLSTPLVFGIAAPIQRGPSGVRLLLKRIET